MYARKKLNKYLCDTNPSELIREIKCRPGIYDKDKLKPPRREHKKQLWLEVAENLTPYSDWNAYMPEEKVGRVEEVQHKWKHLRNHFLREVKLIESGQTHKKRKYIYYDDMEFIKPFVGIKLPRRIKLKVELEPLDDSDRDTGDNNDEPTSTHDEPSESFVKAELTSSDIENDSNRDNGAADGSDENTSNWWTYRSSMP